MTDLYEGVKLAIAEHNNPELAKEPGMVYQVWEDGEITLQKSGELLGQRSLHCITPGVGFEVPLDLFPNMARSHANIYTTSEGAEAVRLEILKVKLEYTKWEVLQAGDEAVRKHLES